MSKKNGKNKHGPLLADLEKEWDKKVQRKLIKRLVRQYMKFPYQVDVQPHLYGSKEHQGYFFDFPELPGCMGDADTWKELGAEIKSCMEDYLTISLEDGHKIPLPRPYTRPYHKRYNPFKK